MQGRDVRVNLAFTANTSQAKAQIKDLTRTLNELTNITAKEISISGLNKDLAKGHEAAFKLKTMLEQAVNTDTGRLDLSKLNQSLKASGTSLKKLGQDMGNLGVEGVKAFGQMASAIANAEVQLKRTNKTVDKLWTSFKNTATWMFTSNVLQGFTQSISTALDYAEKLNGTLNDIRIVTGNSSDEMANFAVAANKAAKALSTTTNEYAKASLIYFQQGGFTDEEIAKRTAVTVKMANVTGESVQEISNQLTAIWNNFDNGTQSLEYYADVVARLGAETASSSKEISDGLDKFAAIANTVGLSYEYAASALATVTAETRQSADVVGTAFKTLFARIQDLELGKTLDDGTTLGQYSEALSAVGISIKDTSGAVKSMNTILDEMGSKWDSLSKDQQIALAQSVAGTRQYTQLIALMDNWDKFQNNVQLSLTSSGTLKEQAEIYAESWEAAKKEVQASAEAIYQALINDEFFIDVTNMAADLLDTLKEIIDMIGGVPGILGAIAAIVPKLFGNQILSGLHSLWSNFSSESKQMIKEAQALKLSAMGQAAAAYGDVNDPQHREYNQSQNTIYENQKKLKEAIFNINRELTDEEIKQIELIEREARVWDDILLKLAEKQDLLNEQTNELKDQQKKLQSNQSYWKTQQEQASKELKNSNINLLSNKKDSALNKIKAGDMVKSLNLDELKEALKNKKFNISINPSVSIDEISEAELENIKNKLIKEGEETARALKSTFETALKNDKITQEQYDAFEKYLEATVQLERNGKNLNDVNKKLKQSQDELTESEKQTAEAANSVEKAHKNAQAQIEAFNNSAAKLGQNLMDIVSGLGQIAMGINMLEAAVDIFNDDSLSGWEKFLKLITTVSMALPALVGGLNSVKKAFDSGIISQTKDIVTKGLQIAATKGAAAAAREHARAKQQEAINTDKATVANVKKAASDKLSNSNNWFSNQKNGIKQEWGNLKNTWNDSAFDALSKDQQNEMLDKLMGEKGYSRIGGDGKKLPFGKYQNAAGEVVTKKDAVNLSGVKGAAGKTALKSMGTKLLAGAATAAVVVASLAAAKAIYDAADEAYNRDEYAAQRAEKAASNLASAYEKAANSYAQFDAAADAHFNTIQSLEKLTKGTLEYEQGIASANEEALKLINTYDELAGQYYTTAEGLIVFNEGALDNIHILELQRKNAAAVASTIAQQNAREARIQADKTKYLREKVRSNEAQEITTEDKATAAKGGAIGLGAGAVTGGAAALIGLETGAIAGTWAGPIGAAIGAAIGVTIGAITGIVTAAIDKKEATEKESKAIDTLAKAYAKMGDQALTKDNMAKLLGEDANSELIESLSANREELTKLMQAIKANTEARIAENTNLARQLFAGKDAAFVDLESPVQGAITTIAGAIMTKREDEIDRERKDYTKGRWYTLGIARSTKQGREQFNKYLEDQGINMTGKARFSRDGIKYSYIGENNEKVDAVLDYETLEAWQEGQEIAGEIEKSYDGIRQSVLDLYNVKGGEGLASILSGQDVNQLTKQQIDDLRKAYESGEFDEELREFGQLTGENYSQAVADAINSWDYDAALSNYANKTKAEIDSILSAGSGDTGASAQALENYSKVIMKNSAALSTWSDEFEKLDNKKVAAEMAVAQAKFAKGVVSLNEVMSDNLEILEDWNEQSLSTWEAVAKVQESLQDIFGLEVSSDFVRKYLKEIKALADGDTSSLEELRQAAAEDFIMNLNISDASKNEFLNLVNDLVKQAEVQTPDIEVGATINDSSYIAQLNEMLAAGDLTAEEVKKTFAAIGYAVDIQTTKKKMTTTSHYTVSRPNEEPETYDVTSTTVMDVPYIAGKGTQSVGEQITTSTGETVTVGQKNSGFGFRRTDSEDNISGLLGDTLKETAKHKKQLKKEVDRYKDIREQLSDIERALNKISKAKERAFGASKVKLIEQEITKTEELLAAEEKYRAELEAGYQDDLANLDSRFILENGRIINYSEVLNGLIDDGVSDEKYKEIKDAADQYIATLNELESQQEVVNDVINQIADLQLEKIEYEVEYNIHLNERELKQLEYQLKNLADPIYDAAKAIEILGDKTQLTLEGIETYKKGITDILRQELSDGSVVEYESILEKIQAGEEITHEQWMSLLDSDGLSDKAVSTLEDYVDSLYDAVDAMDSFYEEMMEKVGAAFDEMNKKAEKSIERNEQLSHTIETYHNIIDLVGKKQLGVNQDQIRALGREQVALARQNLQLKQRQLEMDREALKQAEGALQAANERGDTEAVKYWREQIESMKEDIWALEGEVEAAWVDTLQIIAEDFTKAVQSATSTFEEAMTGIYGSYDKMQEVFNQQKEIGDRYVEDYQKIYELSKLNRDLNESIDNTDSIRGKQALRDLQQEINALQESDTQMSEYDLEYLRKKYDLRVAEIALEEAQNAKSQVRMQRDAEGNWGYVYTADEAKIDSAQQNYEDKLYELQSFSQSHIDKMQQLVLQAEQDLVEALNALRAEDFATQEEYQKEVTRITNYYTGMRNYALDELNKSLEHSSELYQKDWEKYSETTGYKISEEPKWRKAFTDTEYAMVTGYDNIDEARLKFEINTANMVTKLTGAFKQWEVDVSGAFNDVGKTVENFGSEDGALNKTVKEVGGQLDTLTTDFNTMASQAETAFGNIVTAADTNFDAFRIEMAKYKTQIEAITRALTEMIRLSGTEVTVPDVNTGPPSGVQPGSWQGGNVDANDDDYELPPDPPSTDPGYNSPVTYREEGYDPDPPFEIGDKVKNATGKKLLPYDGTEEVGYQQWVADKCDFASGTVQDKKTAKDGTNYYYTGWTYNGIGVWDLGVKTRKIYFKESDLVKAYDTGGYTGEWDSSGRLAMLHQKEIVLNARDTENFLAAVNIVRDIANVIDLQAMAYGNGLGRFAETTVMPRNGQVLQQEVTIHAEFPNATQRTEIEAAFDTLLNRASQFANRKN